MLVKLGCEGVRPEHWIGYAQYINQNVKDHVSEHIVDVVKKSRVRPATGPFNDDSVRPMRADPIAESSHGFTSDEVLETSASFMLMTRWPNPEAVLQAVATPELNGWRKSILEAKSPPLPKQAWIMGRTAPQYSPLLAECQDAPSFLFGLGDPDCFDRPAIAIVGSRRPSLDGIRLAEHFGFELAKAGFVIVSGLAQGVDTAAHKGALAAGGRTIAVMATGIETVYPASNRGLSADIEASGAVVTEFFPGSAPKRHHFRRRNRTISGLSIATVVIEAGVPSGTLITATAATEQGRDVYALPWSINHKQGEGCLKLLLEGALLATDPQDVIEGSCWSKPISAEGALRNHRASHGIVDDLGEQDAHSAAQQSVLLQSRTHLQSLSSRVASPGSNSTPHGPSDSTPVHELSAEQKALLQLMGDGDHSAESLSLAMGSNIRDIHRVLTSLEVSNLVVRHRSGYSKR